MIYVTCITVIAHHSDGTIGIIELLMYIISLGSFFVQCFIFIFCICQSGYYCN